MKDSNYTNLLQVYNNQLIAFNHTYDIVQVYMGV